jgi:modification methylase
MEMHKLYLGNCIDVMQHLTIPIDLIVTSPPYFVGKEYESDVLWQDYSHMMQTFYTLSSKVLVPGGYVVINFGDFHNSKNRFFSSVVPSTYPASIEHWSWGSRAHTYGMLDLQAARVWAKNHAKVGMGHVCNVRPRHSFDFEHVWTWRKQDVLGKEWVNDRSLSQRGVIGKDWKSSARIDRHCAAFPIELPDWAIKVYTKDETRDDAIVLDPFMGSGTTCVAAIKNGCSFIGVEKNKDYIEIAVERIRSETGVNLTYEEVV